MSKVNFLRTSRWTGLVFSFYVDIRIEKVYPKISFSGVRMRSEIKHIEYYLPETILTNEQLARENPSWGMDQIENRCGVKERHIASDHETALDLAVEACFRLFAKNLTLKEDVDALIFCTQSGDYIMPPNSCLLHGRLDLKEAVLSFDINLACSGYIYGLTLARGLLASGAARNVLLINADTYSKYIHKEDRSARVLFGDGAAVSWITSSDSDSGILDLECCTLGKEHKKFMITAGGCRLPKSSQTAKTQKDSSGNVRSLENIQMDGIGILTFVDSKIPSQIKRLLLKNNLSVEGIDLFIFHQASKVALDSLTRLLKLRPGQVFRNISLIGNTVSASIPIAIKDARDQGKLQKGTKVVLCGFGVGLSWGTALLEI